MNRLHPCACIQSTGLCRNTADHPFVSTHHSRWAATRALHHHHRLSRHGSPNRKPDTASLFIGQKSIIISPLSGWLHNADSAIACVGDQTGQALLFVDDGASTLQVGMMMLNKVSTTLLRVYLGTKSQRMAGGLLRAICVFDTINFSVFSPLRDAQPH